MNRYFACLVSNPLFCTVAHAQSGPTVPPAMTAGPLSLELAQQAADAALQACKKIGYPNATSVVVDTGGHTLLVWRSPTAVDPTIEAARRKAYTAAKTGMTSAEFGKSKGWSVPTRPPANAGNAPAGVGAPGEPPVENLPPGAVRSPTATPGVPSIIYDGDPNLVPMGGGLPIMSHGKVVGGIGLSGAMGPVLDEQCSSAGANAIKDKVKDQ